MSAYHVQPNDEVTSHRSYASPSYSDDLRDDIRNEIVSQRSAPRSERSHRSHRSRHDPSPSQDLIAVPPQEDLAMAAPLPAAYYDEPPPPRSRRRSVTPPHPITTRRGEILSAVGGAIAATAADKYIIEPRMRARSQGNGGRGRNKSRHEFIRRAADIGAGGLVGTAAYRAISRSRARSKAKAGDMRPGSPDDRDRDRVREKEKSGPDIPWKSLLSTAAGGLAGLATEQVTSKNRKEKERRRRRDDYSDDDYSDDSYDNRDRRLTRRHRSADGYDGRRSTRRDSVLDDRVDRPSQRRGSYGDGDDDYDDYDRRDRRRRRDRSRRRDKYDDSRYDSRQGNPHQTRDLVQEAIGLLGVAQGLRGQDKGAAAVKTAIGAYGLANQLYNSRKARQPQQRPQSGYY